MKDIDPSNPVYFWSHRTRKENIGKECLSNWYPSEFIDNEQKFYNEEQHFMYKKALLFKDFETADKILQEKSPSKCKELGRMVKNFNDKIWKNNCIILVQHGCFLKFSQNPLLKEYLLSTENRLLVEASPRDKIWGIGLDATQARKIPSNKWPGTNYLGICLMNVRELLRE